MKLWGGRFESGPSKVFEQFSGSLRFDRALLAADIEGSIAFAKALARSGIISARELEQMITAFDQIKAETSDEDSFAGATDEDIHTFVIRKLGEKQPELAAKIHTGRSRNEQVSLDLRLYLRAAVDVLLVDTKGLCETLLRLAEANADAVIPGYTHLRRAQPVLWPHYLLAYFEMLARDAERLRQARARINVMPLGSGAIAGNGFGFDREAIARDLDFAAITANSMDVSGDRDFALDFLYAASTIMLHLSRMAEDWILYSSEEFGWITLGDDVTSGSSLMPQKKNPDSLELIRGKSGRVFADFTALFVTMKGLPMTYNRDMQEDKEPLFDAYAQTSGSLRMMTAVAGSMRLNPEVPREAASRSWTVATDLAEELARQGVPFHRAHKLVGQVVLQSVRDDKSPADWDGASLAGFAPEFTPAMARLLDPVEGMKTRELPGGTGPLAVSKALRAAQSRLAEL